MMIDLLMFHRKLFSPCSEYRDIHLL
jgi:hypothetical protein